MFGFKSISYEEMRLEYFRKQRDAAERRMNYWCGAKQADRVGWMEASDRASEAGAQYSFYEDALKALKNQPKWNSVIDNPPDKGDIIFAHDPDEGWIALVKVIRVNLASIDVKAIWPEYSPPFIAKVWTPLRLPKLPKEEV